MKNVIKKISAFTMAFTLLGTGTAISKTIVPISAYTNTASAAFNSYNGTVKTQGGNLNVRSGPGANYKKVRALSNGSRVTIYEENNGWGRISSSQEWVSLSYIIRETTNDVTKIFSDVSSGQWYVDAIQYVYDHGLMNGISANTFGTNDVLTRAQFVTVLYNMKGDENVEYKSTFTDVPDNTWYSLPVTWAVDNGITSGIGNNKFGPDLKITREQMVVMLAKYAGYDQSDTTFKSIDLKQHFNDGNKVDTWASDAVKWALYKNIISGKQTNDGFRLDPLGNATRAECAQVINNFLNPAPTPKPIISSVLINNTSLGLSDDKKRTMTVVMDKMLEAGFKPAFVCGVLGNIASEGTFGKFESSAYTSYPEKEPDYLVYMDTYYNYRNEYSGQYIMNKSLSKVYSIICELDQKGYRDKGSRCGFGLGCAQWTFERTKGLIEKYRSVAGYRDSITAEEVMLAEGLYMIDEFKNSEYNSVYSEWSNNNSTSYNSETAAYDAGKIVCTKYECPKECNSESVWEPRAEMAKKIYDVCFE